jgi:hypothetical protein
MPIIFDEVTAEIAPPAPTSSTHENPDAPPSSRVDASAVLRELQLIAERADRLRAD